MSRRLYLCPRHRESTCRENPKQAQGDSQSVSALGIHELLLWTESYLTQKILEKNIPESFKGKIWTCHMCVTVMRHTEGMAYKCTPRQHLPCLVPSMPVVPLNEHLLPCWCGLVDRSAVVISILHTYEVIVSFSLNNTAQLFT